MAEAISGIAGGLQGSVNGMLNQGSAWLDSIFPPEKRNELVARISKFAKEKPMLAVRLCSLSSYFVVTSSADGSCSHS